MPIHLLCLFFSLSLTFSAKGDELKLEETEAEIRITLGEKPVLTYLKMEKSVPEGIAPHFKRSGYIHPVYSPDGQEVSGDFPADHAHQHALFFAWTKVSYQGKKVDFWNQAKKLGHIKHRRVIAREKKPTSVSFTTEHIFTAGKKQEDALVETWQVTVHKTPLGYFLFDIKSEQNCAGNKPLTIEKYHYGGMAFRGNGKWVKDKGDHSINPGDLTILTSEQKDRWQGNHSRPNWVLMSGELDKGPVSITIMCHPNNFRAPQAVRIHPNKPYFCFSPMVDSAFEIKPGKPYVSRYRYLVTSAAPDPKLIDRYWQALLTSGK